jgi:hypothetical protein
MSRKKEYGLGGRLRTLFHGRSSISSQNSPSSVDSQKSPAPRLGLSILLSPTIDLPGLPSHTSPSSQTPAPPESTSRLASPTGSTISALPSAWSRQPRPHSPLQALSHPGQSSPQTDWNWEHVRDGSGNVRRRRKRKMGQTRPKHGMKSILRSKTGRLKLLRCLGLGSLLAIGLTVCKQMVSLKTDIH